MLVDSTISPLVNLTVKQRLMDHGNAVYRFFIGLLGSVLSYYSCHNSYPVSATHHISYYNNKYDLFLALTGW